MSFITLSIKHGQTRDEARRRLEAAVADIHTLLGSMVRGTVWSADRSDLLTPDHGLKCKAFISVGHDDRAAAHRAIRCRHRAGR